MRRIVPYAFTDFLAHAVGVQLSPAQAAMWRVLAGEAQPHELEGEQLEAARHLFGGAEEIPPDVLSVCAVVKGARIGGSYLCALRLLDLAMAVPLEGLAAGEVAFGIIAGPDMRLAEQTFRYVTGAVDSSPALSDREESRKNTAITLVRDDGRLVTIECLPATRGGSALRSRTLVGAVLDEAAFFRDESAVVNDVELYKAVAPRVVEGGQVLINSTPWVPAGLLHDLFTKNHGTPRTAVAVHAPTPLMRSNAPHILRLVERERERDPDNAAREFDAEFLAAGSGMFFDPAAVEEAVDERLHLPLPLPKRGQVAVAVDPGFTRDAATLAAVAYEDGILTVLCLDELRPQKGQPLQPSAVVSHWAQLATSYGVREVLSDVHYREAVREHFAEHRLAVSPVPEGQKGKIAMYERTRAVLNEGRLRLPRHSRLLGQLKEVVAKPTPGGGMTITSPRKKGGHGDLVSALVAAVHAFADGPREYAYEAVPNPRRGHWMDDDGDAYIGRRRYGPGAL